MSAGASSSMEVGHFGEASTILAISRDKVVRSAYGSLLRAGFSSAIIRDELFKRTRRSPTEDNTPLEDAEA